MSGWLPWLIGLLVLLLALAVAGWRAWRDECLREFMEAIEDLRWREVARGVWGLVRDRRVPWFVRLLPVPVLLYLATPIDLIPDFVPFIGQADDILIVAAALWVVLRFTPGAVVREHFRVGRAED